MASLELVAHRSTGHRPILRLDDDPHLGASGLRRIQGDDEVALLRAHDPAGLAAGAVEQVAGAASQVGKHRFEEILEVGPLGRRPGPFGPSGGCRGLDCRQPLVQSVELARDFDPELMHGGVLARGIQEDGELRRVAVEVGPEQRPHPPDRAVALRLVEQLAHVRAEGALVAEELLEGPRQAPVAIGEVGAERLVERLRGPDVDLLRLPDQLLELRPDDVDVHGDAGVLEREEADLQRALDERRPLIDGPLREERCQSGVADDEALDHDSVRVDVDLVGRELDDSCFHAPDPRGRS